MCRCLSLYLNSWKCIQAVRERCINGFPYKNICLLALGWPLRPLICSLSSPRHGSLVSSLLHITLRDHSQEMHRRKHNACVPFSHVLNRNIHVRLFFIKSSLLDILALNLHLSKPSEGVTTLDRHIRSHLPSPGHYLSHTLLDSTWSQEFQSDK